MSEVPKAPGTGDGAADPAWQQPQPWKQPYPGGTAHPSVSAPPDPLFPDPAPSWQPRIVPSPPPQRGRLITGLLIGLLAGLLVFGGAGFAAGRWTAPENASGPGGTSSTPTASPSLGAFEQSQLSLNQPKFSGELARFAEPWLARVSGCQKNGDPGGPVLERGEESRVMCRHGSMSLYFVQYQSTAERDKTRIGNLAKNVDARQLTPGAAEGQEGRATPSQRTTGSYIEYAYRAGTGAATRTVAALWWDDADAPVGAFLLAYWEEGVGKSWEPMRDVWARHA